MPVALMSPGVPNEATRAAAVTIRRCELRDGLGMWRLARHGLAGRSPFLYLSIARRCSSCCAVAERDGELVAFAILAPPIDESTEARLLQLYLAPAVPGLETALALLAFLLQLPSFARTATVEMGSRCPPHVLRTLRALAKIELPEVAPSVAPARPFDRLAMRGGAPETTRPAAAGW